MKKALKISSLEILTLLSMLYVSFVYLNFAYSNVVLILLILGFVWALFKKQIPFEVNKVLIKDYILILIPFLLTLISVLLSSNKSVGLSYLVLKLALVFVPFIILILFKEQKQLQQLGYIFIIFSLLALFKTLINYYALEKNFRFNIVNIQKATVIQHPYFGVFQVLAIIFLLEFYQKLNKFIFLVVFSLLSFAVFFSTGRIAYLMYFIVIFLYTKRFFSKKLRYAVLLGLSLAVFGFIYSSKQIKQKFELSFNIKNSPRLKIWNNSYLVLKNAQTPLLGVGIGDYYSQKKEPYWLRGIIENLKDDYKGLYGYDSHNIYIEFLLLNGVLGLSYILLMIYILYISIKRRNIFLISLAIILILFSFTETILNRQYGIILYVFLMPIIFNFSKNKITK